MKKAAIDKLIMEDLGLSALTRRDIEDLQLRLLNMQIERSRAQGGFYSGLPPLSSLDELKRLPFTTSRDLEEN